MQAIAVEHRVNVTCWDSALTEQNLTPRDVTHHYTASCHNLRNTMTPQRKKTTQSNARERKKATLKV